MIDHSQCYADGIHTNTRDGRGGCRDRARQRATVTPVSFREMPNDNRHVVLLCLDCQGDRVEIDNIQAATRTDPTRHVTVELSGQITEDEFACPADPKQDPRTISRPRVAITYQCADCGYAWSVVQTQKSRRTYTFKSNPTRLTTSKD